MNQTLKESTTHGTKDYPFALYQMHHLKGPFHVSMHWHEEIEIIYVEEGTLHLAINNHPFLGEAGAIYIVNAKEIHEMYVKDSSTRYSTVLFPISSLVFQEMDGVNKEYLLPLARGEIIFSNVVCEPGTRKEVQKLLQKIIHMNKEKAPSYRLGTKALLMELLFLLISSHTIFTQQLPQEGATRKREILTYIGEHFTSNITLDEIAGFFHMSPKYFSRYFKNVFHVTLTEYITRLRMEQAAMLLSTTDLSVTEVSMQSGFNNISFFIRTFQKNFGCSPKKYR